MSRCAGDCARAFCQARRLRGHPESLNIEGCQELMMRIAIAVTVSAALLAAVAGQAAAPQPLVKNKSACDSLRGLTIPASALGLPTTGATIGNADLIPATGQSMQGQTVVLALPEYCKVTGYITPVDPAAPRINFHVNLPTSWNRKLAQMGGSGNNGSIPVALTTGMQWGPESLPPNAPYALSRGFVTYGSDSGHQNGGGRGQVDAAQRGRGRGTPDSTQTEDGRGRAGGGQAVNPPGADWTANDEAMINFTYAQMKKTHDVAVALVGKFYSDSIRHSYYLGSSQGGREALMVAQRFPEDYDGVFAQVPGISLVHLSIIDPLLRARGQMTDGWIPPAKVAVVAKEVLRQCDGLDGIEDGLVSNYMACNRRFDPAVTPDALAAVRCEGGADTGDTCLSDAQIAAANAVHGSVSLPFALANGWTTFSGWGTGSESAMNWKTVPSKPNPATANFGMLRARIIRDPSVNVLETDLAKYAKEFQELSAMMDASSPDLSAFRRRGGKLIMKANTTDYTVNPRWVMDYYDKVAQTMGAGVVNGFVRFYIAVGLFHNRNVGTNPLTGARVPMYGDFIALLDDWVEQGKAPADTQVLTDMDPTPPFKVNASLPMCRYPMFPRVSVR
jgi:feruloyl esterase